MHTNHSIFKVACIVSSTRVSNLSKMSIHVSMADISCLPDYNQELTLRTVPPIVIAHAFCALHNSRTDALGIKTKLRPLFLSLSKFKFLAQFMNLQDK